MKLWSIPEESQSVVVVVVVVVRKMEVEAQVEDYFSPSRASRVAARGLLTGCPMRFSAESGTRDMRHSLAVRYCYGFITLQNIYGYG